MVNKMYPKYVGPYRVISVEHDVLSVRPTVLDRGEPRRIHSDRVRPCTESFPQPDNLEDLMIPFMDPARMQPIEGIQ